MAPVRRTAMGVLAGGAIFVGIMLLLAALAVAFGWLGQGAPGQVNLQPWLRLEILVGAGASALGGAVSWRIARRRRAPAVLALLVFIIGALEAAGVLRQVTTGAATAPRWLVLLAPVVAATGVLLGGWLAARSSPGAVARPPAKRL